MKSEILQTELARHPERAAAVGEPISTFDRIAVSLVVVVSSLLWLWFTSPKPNYILNLAVPMLVLLVCGVLVPMLVFFVGGIAGLLRLRIPGLTAAPEIPRPYMHPRRRKYYGLTAIFAAVAMVSIMLHVPLHARFALSRPAMDALVANLHEYPNALLPPTMRVGSFVIETNPRQREGGALMFHLAGDGEAGFTYSTKPIEYGGWNRGDGGRLGGGWYWFSDD